MITAKRRPIRIEIDQVLTVLPRGGRRDGNHRTIFTDDAVIVTSHAEFAAASREHSYLTRALTTFTCHNHHLDDPSRHP